VSPWQQNNVGKIAWLAGLAMTPMAFVWRQRSVCGARRIGCTSMAINRGCGGSVW